LAPFSYEIKGLGLKQEGSFFAEYSHVKKGNVRYRYYQSWVLAHGKKAKAGSVFRVPAGEIEQVVIEAMATHMDIIPNPGISESAVEVIRDHLDRLTAPCGMLNGLPVGLMFVARHFDERNILRAAAKFENLGNWKDF
jgi:hypothetical protein